MRRQKSISVKVANVAGGFVLDELEALLEQGWTVNAAYSSSDNALLVVLDAPQPEKKEDE